MNQKRANPLLFFFVFLTLILRSFGVSAQVPYMVEDINIATQINSSSPGSLTAIGTTLYFSANDSANGTELWKSDGTTSGTVLVKDINPGTANSSPNLLTNVSGTLFFSATDGSNGAELWKSDGTAAGTVMVRDIFPGTTGSSLQSLTNVNGMLFFRATTTAAGAELWKSTTPYDAANTDVIDIVPGATGSFPTLLTDVNVSGTHTLFFSATTVAAGRELWKSISPYDVASTVLVKDINPPAGGAANSTPDTLTDLNGTLFFSATDGTLAGAHGIELWKSTSPFDAANTVMVKDINPPAGGTASSSPASLTKVGGTLFFSATDGTGVGGHGTELWKSDGSTGGTVLVQDINIMGTASSSPDLLTNVNSTLFFSANDGTSNQVELWKSDGATATLVKNINPNANATSNPGSLTNVSGTLFLSATDGTFGVELWKSTTPYGAADTVMVKDMNTGGDSSPSSLVNFNNTLFFGATDVNSETELWKSDGFDTGGTTVVKDINSNAGSSSPSGLTNVNGTLFFAANDGTNGIELWKSDGTAAGTVLIDINTTVAGASSSPASFTNVNGTLFFSANDGTNGTELWKSNGGAVGPGGTEMVKDINTTAGTGSSPASLTNVNGTLFFSANDGTNGTELWKSDGSPGGTSLIDIVAMAGSSSPLNLASVGTTLFFSATTAAAGRELWKSTSPYDAANTVLVKDINPPAGGAANSNPASLTNVNGTLFFSATNGATNGIELWKSDGSAGGTVMVLDINPVGASSSPSSLTNVNNTLFFAANDGTNGIELWKSESPYTTATQVVPNINSVPTVVANSSPSSLTNINGTLFFQANDGTNGVELWMSDGSLLGTVLVKDILSGASGSNSQGMLQTTVASSRTILAASNGDQGMELWKSDGTSASTQLVQDITTGPSSSSPTGFTVAGTLAFFSADDHVNGRELWAVGASLGSSPGSVPDGNTVPGTPVTITKAGGSQITLSWGASCVADDTDYEIYEGTIGSFYNHTQMFCTTAGALAKTLTPTPGGNRYYVVVPRNSTQEGSYGKNSSAAERPQGTSPCFAQQIATCP